MKTGGLPILVFILSILCIHVKFVLATLFAAGNLVLKARNPGIS
jgi:hypothetical protein